jgi:hypothetical protein
MPLRASGRGPIEAMQAESGLSIEAQRLPRLWAWPH